MPMMAPNTMAAVERTAPCAGQWMAEVVELLSEEVFR